MGKRILQFFIVILLLISGLIIYAYVASQKELPAYCSYDGSFGQYFTEDSKDVNNEEITIKKTTYVDSSTLNAPENILVIPAADGTENYYRIEIADTQEKHAVGLMYREKLDIDSGMLFIFDKPKPATFWMKNTYIPLDIIFIDEDGKVVDLYENARPESEEYIHSTENVKAVLELNAGAVAKLGVKVGTKIYHQIFEKEEEE